MIRLRGSNGTGTRRGQRLRAVIENSALGAVEREAMDHAGVAVCHKELVLILRIECQPAKCWSGIWHPGQRDIGEQRYSASAAVDFPDRAGSAGGNRRPK